MRPAVLMTLQIKSLHTWKDAPPGVERSRGYGLEVIMKTLK